MISRSSEYPGTIFDPSSRAPGITLPPGGAASSILLFSLHSAACLLVRRRNTVETFSCCLRLRLHLRFPHEDWLITDIQEPRPVLAQMSCGIWLAWNGRFGDYMYGSAGAEDVGARFSVWSGWREGKDGRRMGGRMGGIL